jgi:pimeloyl-ACP methyl ester carboxylesterase
MASLPNIVLVHGAWADGSCWSDVIEALQTEGYRVTAPQFPMTGLADDVARLRQVLARQDGPTIVAGHSYGGQIMTALGEDAPNRQQRGRRSDSLEPGGGRAVLYSTLAGPAMRDLLGHAVR